MRILFFIVFVGLTSSVFAQSEEVTTEELMRYAVAMDSINRLTNNVIEEVTERVKNSTAITAARYNELSRIVNDSTQLVQANATAEEVAALRDILTYKDEQTAKINETFQSLAKEYIGVSTFNKVKKALSNDKTLKQQYDSILSVVNTEIQDVD